MITPARSEHPAHQPHDTQAGPTHAHGLVDESIKRSRDGLRVVGLVRWVLAACWGDHRAAAAGWR